MADSIASGIWNSVHDIHYNPYPHVSSTADANLVDNFLPQSFAYPHYNSNRVTSNSYAVSNVDAMSAQYSLDERHAVSDFAHRNETRVVKHPKPPYSYISLICMSIAESSDKKATLREIIHYIEKNFPYYQLNKKWHGSIRHNLTINDCFLKLPRRPGCKSCHWTIDPAFKDMFDNGSLRRRRYRFKEGSQNWNKSKVNAISKHISKPARTVPMLTHANSPPVVSSNDIYSTCYFEEESTEKDAGPLPCSFQPLPSPDIYLGYLSTDSAPQSSPSPDNSFGDLGDILNTIDCYDRVHNAHSSTVLL